MNVDRRLLAEIADLVTARVLRLVPTVSMGTVTTPGVNPMVVLDGAADAIPVSQLADQAAEGERVWVLQWRRGGGLILGRAGGARLLGYASTSSDQTGITAVTDLTGLSVTVQVTQPNRVLTVEGQVLMTLSASGATAVGAIEQAGATIGAYAFWTSHSASESVLCTGSASVVAPSPGVHTFNLNLARSGAGTVSTASSLVSGFIRVRDEGNVGGTMT